MLNIFSRIVSICMVIFLGLGSFTIVDADTIRDTTEDEINNTLSQYTTDAPSDGCNGIKLNTKVPFIGDCIEFSEKTQIEAFPFLMGHLMKILVTIIILGGFAGIVMGGVMIAAAGPDDQKAKNGKKIIINIAIAMAVLGASGVILRLINPNFFQ